MSDELNRVSSKKLELVRTGSLAIKVADDIEAQKATAAAKDGTTPTPKAPEENSSRTRMKAIIAINLWCIGNVG